MARPLSLARALLHRALSEFAHLENIRVDDLLRIFQEQTSKHKMADGTTKEHTTHPLKRRKIKWMLVDHAAWIQCKGAPERIFFVGNDVDFFVANVAARHPDMQFFKADRLRQFLTGSLNNSGKDITEYTGRYGSDSKWIKMPQAPADALERIPSVPPPSAFAEPASGAPASGSDAATVPPASVAPTSITPASATTPSTAPPSTAPLSAAITSGASAATTTASATTTTTTTAFAV